ncbi:cation-binding hemerythrin HHE family protein [Pigmentiphaga humi]|uniref:Cation-binding hemerythrin HHE family protein n=1 Tax=Pigmentiphaga humi TaxID=2478468 RepID=A0A3P4B7A8_9BURK|nr:hemerythrin domain-containing protein [Pigmentiphaga humi]VCU71490.1 cation-binding hemerythrin HHE family protein [Pigmentiphaga humi]
MKQEPTLRDDNAPRPESDTSLMWSDARLLGFTPMDDSHQEFYEVAFRLLTCTQESAPQALEAFEEHLKSHFGQEEEWMRTTGFPPSDCHIDEHAAVMKSTQEVRELVRTGQAGADLVHDFAMHLFQWFPGHADYLDAALAAWMSKQAFGGKPVVLRRKV